MAIRVVEPHADAHLRPPRLILLWQDPSSRAIHPIGSLDVDAAGGRVTETRFEYLSHARSVLGAPLASFPDFDTTYITSGLPPFFADRLMSPGRDDYDRYVRDLELRPDWPWDEFSLTGGQRVTDNFSVCPLPYPDADGSLSLRFFVHGANYVPADNGSARVDAGSSLALVPEPSNPTDPRALMVHAGDRPLGWLPRWLQGCVEEILLHTRRFEVRLDRVASEAQPNRRYLCSLTARMPDDWAGFDLDPALRTA